MGLDRLHTFVVKFVRQLCHKHGIGIDRSEFLNAIFGKYVKFLVEAKIVLSIMSGKILKYSISITEAFYQVRNEMSLAHDNEILNYKESILIFNNVTNAIKFVRTIKLERDMAEHQTDEKLGNLPF